MPYKFIGIIPQEKLDAVMSAPLAEGSIRVKARRNVDGQRDSTCAAVAEGSYADYTPAEMQAHSHKSITIDL